jgi:hypothetical protein
MVAELKEKLWQAIALIVPVYGKPIKKVPLKELVGHGGGGCAGKARLRKPRIGFITLRTSGKWKSSAVTRGDMNKNSQN